MKFTTMQSGFTKALNQVSRVVTNRTTLPVLSNILIEVEKNTIKLSATDLEVAIVTKTTGNIEEVGKLTVPSRLLSEFISSNNDESISFVSKDTKLNIKSERYEANINGISAEEFPTIPLLSKDYFCTLEKDAFIKAIKKTCIAPAMDETRPVLAGIYFDFKGDSLTMAATDSYRLSEVKLELKEKVEEKKFIVPARTMNEVLRLATSLEVEQISISSTENQVLFQIGDAQVISRLIEGAFPNYTQIIPSDSKTKAAASLADFQSAIKLASLFARNSANNIKIKISKTGMVITSAAGESGEAKSKVPAEVSGKELEVAFNVKYIMDVLPVLESEKILLELNDESSAVIIKSSSEKNFTYLVMPLKLDK